MNILGIETSCDETSAAIVNNKTILSCITASSLKEHSFYGGVIPEIASRRQLEFIVDIVKQSLSAANCSLSDIAAIAVTKKPGLIGSLLVGTSFANALSFALEKPLIPVNHIEAHLYANFLVDKDIDKPNLPNLPAIGLVVSGGHTNLFFIDKGFKLKLLGSTRDDAVGEAFDKVARILNLGYPGGPVIDKLASSVENNDLKFKCADLPGTWDFSFSGIKTAVLYHYRDNKDKENFNIANIVNAFQTSVIKVLVDKAINACKKYNCSDLVVGGGVAANSHLRSSLTSKGQSNKIKVYFPRMALCMDNAAMVAGLGEVLV